MLWGTDTGHNVLTLCIDEVFSIEDVLAGCCIAREGNAGCGVVAHVAVDHGLHVNGGSPFFGNLVHSAVEDGAFVHPAVEYGADAAPQLIPCAFGEVFAGVVLHCGFEEADEVLEVFNVKFGVDFHAFFFFHLVDDGFEGVGLGFGFGFHAENHVAVHLDKTAVAVPCEAGIAALFGESIYRGIVHTEVKHGVHHAWHGGTCAGANGNEEGVLRVVEFLAGEGLHVGDCLFNIGFDILHYFVLAILGVFGAHIGSDSKTGRHRHTQFVHFGEVGTFATEEVSH